MQSNPDEPVDLRIGQCGFVHVVDEEGDALVLFENVEKAQWIFKANLHKLLVSHSEPAEDIAKVGRRALDSGMPLNALTNSNLRAVATAAGLSVADCLTRDALVERAAEARAELQRASIKERTTPLPTGVRLQYNSPSQQRWLDCRVNAVNEAGSIRIDIKPGHWFTLAEQSAKFRPRPFTAGQAVLFRPADSAEDAPWEETSIAAVRDDGGVCVGCLVGRWISPTEQFDVIRQKDALPVLREGDMVVVARGFKSDSDEPVRLLTGQCGIVEDIDEDGDALIAFDAHKIDQWVIASNFDKLYVTESAADEAVEDKKPGESTPPAPDVPQASPEELQAAKDPKSSSSRSTYSRGAGGGMRLALSHKRRGSVVVVAQDFMSDNVDSVPLKSQAVGIVSEVDDDGDILVEFANGNAQWVCQTNQDKIKLVTSGEKNPVKRNAQILVTQDFMSDSVDSRRIRRSSTGRVKEIDGDGDVLVEFGKGQWEWIASSNLDKVAVIGQDVSKVVASAPMTQQMSGSEAGEKRPPDAAKRKTGLVWTPGCIVIAKNDFMSDNYESSKVKALTEGKVVEIDAEGDALVDFGAQGSSQWVSMAHRESLAVVRGPASPTAADGHKLQAGQRVVVRTAFKADSHDRTLLDVGLKGRIEKVDDEGDRLVQFETFSRPQWVFASNLGNLAEVAAETTAIGERAENAISQFKPGMEALYHSTSHERWIPCMVEKLHQDGSVQLDVKPGVWISQKVQRRALRRKGEALFKDGQTLSYNSATLGKWVDVVVTKVRQSDGALQIDAKEGSWLSIADQMSKLKPRFAVEGMVVEVIREMMSDSENNQALMVGRRGVVQEIDQEGDALIKFNGSAGFDWVYRSKLDHLVIISHPDATSRVSTTSSTKVSFEDQCGTSDECIHAGATIAVLEQFLTDSEKQVALKKGQRGVVKEVDDEGDMLVEFHGESKRQWIFKDKIDKLAVVHSATTGEQQTLKQFLEG
mmetsp:Transcript_106160/g.305230  ORF Transcript_106160/g.305230 Transcript_106160/m.305230 type:complete len:979 (+) Transcript_106160:2-2938(+)